MNIVLNGLYAFVATMCFSIIFRCPKKALPFSGFCGMLAWIFYLLFFSLHESVVGATFAGALAASTASQLISRWRKMPITITLLPGIIPLVPGAGMYFTMIYLLQGEYTQAIHKGTETLLIAIAIANAVIIVSSVYRLVNNFLKKSAAKAGSKKVRT